jgi:thiamine kinase-like enzyme
VTAPHAGTTPHRVSPAEAPFTWPTVDDVLARIPASGRAPFVTQELPGGLTNRNYKVTGAGGRPVVVRLSSPQTGLLAIDRDAEHANAVAAARAGVTPTVLGYESSLRALVIEWIEGHTFSSTDLDDAVTLARVADVCRTLHEGCRFGNDFDMFALQRRYLDAVLARGFRLPPRYVEFMPQVDQIRSALSVLDDGSVACHNDLLAANIIDDGDRIWLIDFEYAGNNDPCFELGNIWSEASLAPDRLDELVAAYYGAPAPAKVARARLLGLMSKYGWTLWASIQEATSDVDFDFWSWGMEKYERAVAEFDGPDFARLIADVQAQ